MQIGLDLLGGAMFPDIALNEFPAGWALGIFAEEFGDAAPLVRKIIKEKNPPLVRVQLTWSRNKHIYTEKHLAAARRSAAVYERIAIANPNVKIELSPFCEHDLSNPTPWLDTIARIAPHCEIVNCPWRGALSRRYKNEIHGTQIPPDRGNFNYSFDGTGCVDVNYPAFAKRYAKAETFFLWTYQFNGNRNDAQKDDHGLPLPYIEPTNREFWPTKKLMPAVRYLARKEKGEPELAATTTYKSLSDQITPIPGARDLLPVIITPVKALAINFVTTTGEIVATAPYYGPYRDGRNRYYAPQMGHRLAELARRKQGGNPLLTLNAGRIILGTVNPAHRQNEYRAKP